MPQVVIENPILNSPFVEPACHFQFSDEGITDEIVDQRRSSAYFIPIAKPKKKGIQLAFDTEWTQDRVEENTFINQIRARVSTWRRGNYQGVTKTTRRLLEYWSNPERDKKLFFCQIEALETAIYITEVAGKYGDAWIENSLAVLDSPGEWVVDSALRKVYLWPRHGGAGSGDRRASAHRAHSGRGAD